MKIKSLALHQKGTWEGRFVQSTLHRILVFNFFFVSGVRHERIQLFLLPQNSCLSFLDFISRKEMLNILHIRIFFRVIGFKNYQNATTIQHSKVWLRMTLVLRYTLSSNSVLCSCNLFVKVLISSKAFFSRSLPDKSCEMISLCAIIASWLLFTWS